MAENNPIGVFDSGLGGLTVLSAIRQRLPYEHLVYFGDTARVPYGGKSRDTIVRYSIEIFEFLKTKQVKTIVVACNTASANAMAELRKLSDIPVLGVIEPGIWALLKSAASEKKAAVIATRSTIKSNAYEIALRKENSHITLFSKPCPLFVPLIEEGFQDKKITELVIHEYLDEIIREDIKTIILGCTHYPLIKNSINRLYDNLNLIDSSIETARTLENLLHEHKLTTESTNPGKTDLYLSDITENLQDLETIFYRERIDSVQKVTLGW